AERLQPLVAEDAEPLAQLAEADPQQLGDVLSGLARRDRQDGGQALVDAPVQAFLTAPFNCLALLGSQCNRLHAYFLTPFGVSDCPVSHPAWLYTPILLRRGYNSFSDITARRRAEEELRLANARLELALRGSNIGIWEVDAPDGDSRHGRVYYVNLWEQLG